MQNLEAISMLAMFPALAGVVDAKNPKPTADELAAADADLQRMLNNANQLRADLKCAETNLRAAKKLHKDAWAEYLECRRVLTQRKR